MLVVQDFISVRHIGHPAGSVLGASAILRRHGSQKICLHGSST